MSSPGFIESDAALRQLVKLVFSNAFAIVNNLDAGAGGGSARSVILPAGERILQALSSKLPNNSSMSSRSCGSRQFEQVVTGDFNMRGKSVGYCHQMGQTPLQEKIRNRALQHRQCALVATRDRSDAACHPAFL